MSAFSEQAFAWEPVTPRGVAAFARASFERLLVVQAMVALIATATTVWILSDGVFPVISDAIRQLPEQGEIRSGRLNWRDDSPQLLAEGNIIAISVDLEHSGALRSPADFQFEFGKTSLLIFSLLGELECNYPSGFIIAANQRDARPAWGAWSPDILALVAIAVFFGLLLAWAVLAAIYSLPVWIICFFFNRDLGFWASWKLAGAALMPGALIVSGALVFYGLGVCDLVQFCFACAAHLVVVWIYLFIGPMFLNRAQPPAKQNPFQPQGA